MAPSPIGVRNDCGRPKNYCHSSDYRAGDHHQALLLESGGRRQVSIPDCHNSSTEEFRAPHQDHSHATARCPIAPTVIDAEPSCVSGLPASPPAPVTDVLSLYRDQGGWRKLGIKGIEGAAIPICASDTIGAAPCESRGTAGAGHVCLSGDRRKGTATLGPPKPRTRPW